MAWRSASISSSYKYTSSKLPLGWNTMSISYKQVICDGYERVHIYNSMSTYIFVATEVM